jgi:hypothetical protein
MEDQPTCGKGLADNAQLPAALGQLMGAMADVLEVHTKALDPGDMNARLERDTYRQIAKEQRSISAQLKAAAMKMAACRKLPMGRHDERAMTGREPVSAFKTFVAIERDLVVLLEQRLAEDQQMLASMTGQRRD